MTERAANVEVREIQVGMSSDARSIENLRQNRKTLYVITALYVVIGFILATASAVQGDRLGTFLGFVIISGATGFALILRSSFLLAARMTVMSGDVARIQETLGRLESRLSGLTRELHHVAAEPKGARSQWMDLSAVGGGDPSLLTAATLDRDAYPRLVRSMEENPPEHSATPTQGDEASEPMLRLHREDGNGQGAEFLGTKNLLQTWKRALREGDLLTCRDVYSALVDTTEPAELEPLCRQMEALADRTERPLREAFIRCVHSKDYVGAIAVGEQIRRVLPDRPVAREFERLRPLLERKWEQSRLSPQETSVEVRRSEPHLAHPLDS